MRNFSGKSEFFSVGIENFLERIHDPQISKRIDATENMREAQKRKLSKKYIKLNGNMGKIYKFFGNGGELCNMASLS